MVSSDCVPVVYVLDAAPVPATGSTTIDISTCPITYFGQTFTSIDVSTSVKGVEVFTSAQI